MANAIHRALHAQQVAQAVQAARTSQTNPTPKQNTTRTAAPQDTVTISNAGQAANQAAQSQQAGGHAHRQLRGWAHYKEHGAACVSRRAPLCACHGDLDLATGI